MRISDWSSDVCSSDLYVHALDPQQSNQGALSYTIPITPVPGLAASLGYARSEMEVRSGPFAALGISGPTEVAQLGAEWKFLNRQDLQMQAALRMVRERSTLEALGFQLSDHRDRKSTRLNSVTNAHLVC